MVIRDRKLADASDPTDLDIEAELAKFEAEQRAALGLGSKTKDHWTDEMVDPQFAASQKAHTTLLVGGLTMAHDYLVEGGLTGLGYTVRALDCPDTGALRHGKEFGNRGQCNPTYFTVGSLVQELCRLRDEEGLSAEHIVENYLFLTAGACGPCRFGMYVTEYRKALRDAGFDGFRVMLFQQTGGLKQASGEELGLKLDPEFFITVGKCLFAGDIMNVMGYRMRPYEVVPGSADKALDEAKKGIYDALAQKKSVLAALYRARKIFQGVELDRLQPKPRVAVLGEFWAMTTEGDGNYHLQRFLEEEGSEVDIQCLINLLLYNLWEFRHDTKARMELKGADDSKFGLADSDVGLTLAGLFFAEVALRVWWQSWAKLVGVEGHVLPDMDEVATYGHSFYNQELRGGEGHLEVAKLIMNVVKNKAHMTLSVKPFGCMPSSGVSDGVQSVVTERYPEAIYCAVETSGDAAVNFYSRVQMFLFKARLRAQAEYQEALEQHGVTEEQIRELATGKYARAFHKPVHIAAGGAADIVHELAPLVGKSRLGKVGVRAQQTTKRFIKWTQKDLPSQAKKWREIAPFLPALARRVGLEAKDFMPIVDDLVKKTVRDLVMPTAEESASIERAAAAPAPTTQVRPQGSLPVMG
ncbi:MAG: 2-hydroxyglutaryl-CoA dehydratase [Sandaracinaceae bacterium]